jgi:hypothetical protein
MTSGYPEKMAHGRSLFAAPPQPFAKVAKRIGKSARQAGSA